MFSLSESSSGLSRIFFGFSQDFSNSIDHISSCSNTGMAFFISIIRAIREGGPSELYNRDSYADRDLKKRTYFSFFLLVAEYLKLRMSMI